MSSITIICATKERDYKNTLLYKCGATPSTFIANNEKSLAQIYNAYIQKDYKDNILVMCHDDLTIDDIRLEEKINEALEK